MYKLICGEDTKFGRTGEALIDDHLHARDFYTNGRPGIESQINRLAALVGKISDTLGINLLEMIDRDELEGKYEFVPESGAVMD